MSPGTSEAPRTAYRIRAVEFAACNCKHGCNCQFGGFPNDGFCEFILACQVSDGRYGDVDLTGTRFAVAFRYPDAIHEGNGRAVWFLEETATEEQATALEAILTGRAGGMPWEAMAATLVSFEGPVRAPIEIVLAERRSRARIPGMLDLRLTPLTDPVTGAEKEVNIVYPTSRSPRRSAAKPCPRSSSAPCAAIGWSCLAGSLPSRPRPGPTCSTWRPRRTTRWPGPPWRWLHPLPTPGRPPRSPSSP